MFWEIGCWEWVRCFFALFSPSSLLILSLWSSRKQDVCAGAAIALEAGGTLFGGSGRALDGVVDGDLLQGRKYLVIRSMPGELKAQKILALEFLGQVEDWDQ